jgi:DNA-binding FadR family transcriptional regulator
MDIGFKKIRALKSYEHVVDEIQTAICEGRLKAGDRLPSEMKLKEMFDTSRGSIREALRVLEQKGLVSVSTGVKGGAVVQKATSKPMADNVAILIRQRKISLAHLAEFRKLLEGHIAFQAAVRADAQDIEQLQSILDEAQDHIRTGPSGWDRFHKMDARFHLLLAKVAGNPLVEANLAAVHDNIRTYFHHYLPWSLDLLRENYQDLCEIVKAIREKNPEKAGTIARNHVARFNELMEKNADN